MYVECRTEYEIRGLGFSIRVNLNAYRESFQIILLSSFLYPFMPWQCANGFLQVLFTLLF